MTPLDYYLAINRAEQDGFPNLAWALVQLYRQQFPAPYYNTTEMRLDYESHWPPYRVAACRKEQEAYFAPMVNRMKALLNRNAR